jgi:ADP-ribosylglycohydrolase
MLGSIIGDIAGSIYEFSDKKPLVDTLITSSCFFTDDTVMTLAVAQSLISTINDTNKKITKSTYINYFKKWGSMYPSVGYGQSFKEWLKQNHSKPYYSYGNGSAMRVGPIGWVFKDLKTTLIEAKKSAIVTHNHPDGIKGAQAVAGSIYLARTSHTKEEIKYFVERKLGYKLTFNIENLHENYKFEIKCSKSVPQAIYAFLISDNFEDALKNAIYIGGDTDTICCITGSIAEAYYKHIPTNLIERTYDILDASQKEVINQFRKLYIS